VIVVVFDELGTIALPRSFFDLHAVAGHVGVGLDHAYAVTSYGVQGRTFAESTSIIDIAASLPETYVDITRGQQANHLWLTRRDEPDPERLPRLPQPPVAQQITTRLAGSGPERTAIELDADVGAAGRLAQGRSLAELRAERERLEACNLDASGIARAEQLVAARIAWDARRHPPPEITGHLPSRPVAPHLRRRWETAVATAAVYRARWEPDLCAEAWGCLLGPTPDAASEPDRAQHRQEAERHLNHAVECLPCDLVPRHLQQQISLDR
jgi:hypothetical protein